MKLFDIVCFYETDNYGNIQRKIGSIIGFKQHAIKDSLCPDWDSDKFYIGPNRLETIFSVMTETGIIYDKKDYDLKPIELKLLEDYTVDELIKEISIRKNINTMNSGNVTTIIKR